MRTSSVIALAVVALVAAGCASGTPEESVGEGPEEGSEAVTETSDGTTEDESDEVVEWVFGVGEQISVELTLYSGDDGGRGTPVFSGYRPTVEFDHLGQSVPCSLQLPSNVSPFEPGDTHLVGLECDEEVTVHVDELGFVLTEGGKENGDGEVVLTEM